MKTSPQGSSRPGAGGRRAAALALFALASVDAHALQDPPPSSGRRITAGPDRRVALDFQHFYTLRELEDALRSLAAGYPEFVRLESMGASREGHELWVVTLSSFDGADASSRPALFVAAGLGAGEAQGTEMALSSVVEFLENHERDPAVSEVLARAAIHVAPCLDPDARLRLFEATENAHPRRAEGATALDRNFPTEWDPWLLGTAGGPYPLSEPESQAVAEFLLAHDNVAVVELLSSAPFLAGAPRSPSTSLAIDPSLAIDIDRHREVAGGVRALLRDASHFGAYPDLASRPGSLLDFAYQELGAFAFATDVALSSPLGSAPTVASLSAASEGSLDLPPVSELPHLGRRAWQATLGLARALPRLELRANEVQRLKNDLWQIDLSVANTGELPTLSAMAAVRAACAPPRLSTRGGKVVAAAVRAGEGAGYEVVGRALEDFPLRQVGASDALSVRLVVQAPAEASIELALASRRGGGARATLTLR